MRSGVFWECSYGFPVLFWWCSGGDPGMFWGYYGDLLAVFPGFSRVDLGGSGGVLEVFSVLLPASSPTPPPHQNGWKCV